jgi:hypothetical protein
MIGLSENQYQNTDGPEDKEKAVLNTFSEMEYLPGKHRIRFWTGLTGFYRIEYIWSAGDSTPLCLAATWCRRLASVGRAKSRENKAVPSHPHSTTDSKVATQRLVDWI